MSADLDGPTDSTRNTQSSVLSRNLCNEYSIEAVSGINDVARQAVESIGFRRQSNPSGLQRQSSNDLGTEFSRQSNDEGSVDVVTKRNDIGRQSSKYLGAECSGGGRGKVCKYIWRDYNQLRPTLERLPIRSIRARLRFMCSKKSG